MYKIWVYRMCVLCLWMIPITHLQAEDRQHTCLAPGSMTIQGKSGLQVIPYMQRLLSCLVPSKRKAFIMMSGVALSQGVLSCGARSSLEVGPGEHLGPTDPAEDSDCLYLTHQEGLNVFDCKIEGRILKTQTLMQSGSGEVQRWNYFALTREEASAKLNIAHYRRQSDEISFQREADIEIEVSETGEDFSVKDFVSVTYHDQTIHLIHLELSGELLSARGRLFVVNSKFPNEIQTFTMLPRMMVRLCYLPGVIKSTPSERRAVTVFLT